MTTPFNREKNLTNNHRGKEQFQMACIVAEVVVHFQLEPEFKV